MLTVSSADQVTPDLVSGGSVVAVGKFDGIHLGHRSILARMQEVAEAENLTSTVLTFTDHPMRFLRPEACPVALTSPEQRLELLADIGVDICVMVDFTAEFAAIPADEFISNVLVQQLNAKHIILGADFRFGHRGQGDSAMLIAAGKEFGFTVEVVDGVTCPGVGNVSSSMIREALRDGDMEAAARMLGRTYAIRATVVHGDARGRDLGFPTANLGGVVEGKVPADGVYAGWTVIDGERRQAAISVGNNPTFTPDAESRVEAFILDFSGDLYGKSIEVQFLQRLRGMEKYDSLDALLEQMHDDVVQTRRVLESA
ncbi:bifunctional riboflavin kinase/FAD synthetase [Leucobacter sp. 1207-22]|uniref:bifunctional riboflavin kinase/FAD synthetase n=1 Tax=Leucobacter sp. 1207-22 TaxID=2604456 RepID=UPI004063DFF7